MATALALLTPSQLLAQATLIAGWDFQTTNTGGTSIAVSPNTPVSFNANFGSGTLFLNGSNSSSTWLPATELNAFTGTATNASNGLTTNITSPAALAVLNTTANAKAAVFSINTAGYTNVSVTLAAQRTASGFTNQLWEVSADGSTWASIGNLVAGTIAGTIQTNFAGTGVIGFTNIPQLANLSNARVRVTFTGASSSSGNNRIDNIQFVGEPASFGPSITVNTNSLAGLTATQGNPGIGTNFFTASGSNLSNNITVSVPGPHFQISTNTDPASFNTNLFLLTNGSGAVAATPIYVRLTGINAGTFTTNVSLISGTNSTNVAVSGTVAPPPVPTLTVVPTNGIGPLQTVLSNVSVAPYGTYNLSGAAITNSVAINAPDGLEISYTNDGTGFGSVLGIPAAPPGGVFSTNIFVRISSNALIGPFTNFVTNSTIGGTNNTLVRVVGRVFPAGFALISPANGTTISNFTATRPNPSTNQEISVSGTNLLAGITITPPPGWEISATNSNNPTTNSIEIPETSPGFVTNTPLFIRMASSVVATNYTNSVLTLVSGTNTNSILLLGTVDNPPPSLSLSTNNLTNFTTVTNTFSTNQTFLISGSDLTSNVTVTPTNGWQVSATNTNNFSSSPITIGTNAGGAVSASVHLRIGQVASVTNFTDVPIRVASGGTNLTLLASGRVTLPPGTPEITGFSPTNGPRGTLVTINGPNVGTNPPIGVTFGGAAALTVSPVSSNQVTAVVPPAAPTGRIVLSNAVNSSTSSINFTIDPLSLRIPPNIGAGTSTPARISIPSPAPSDVVVTLSSSASPTISVPATVTIPAGQSYAVFSIAATPIGAPVSAIISAITGNYLGATATTTATTSFTPAASLMEEGYTQNFATFTNFRLPLGWTNTPSVANSDYRAWGTSNTGLKFSTETVNVFGVQHQATSTATNSQILTLRNDTGTNVARIRITYTGRTTNAFTNVNRFPAYTVTVAATAGTNAPLNVGNLTNLSYSTGQGDSFVVSGSLALTNTNPLLANGIPPWTNFTVTWSSEAGDGSENSAQIGLGDLKVELAKPYVQLVPVAGVSDLITQQGTPSAPRAFYVSGQDLQGPLVVTAPTNFEVSLADSTVYGPAVSLTPVAGTVPPTIIFARIKGSAPISNSWDAYNDFYLSPTASGWSGATSPSTAGASWGYYDANVNGFGFPTLIGSFFTLEGAGSGTQNLYRFSSNSPLGNTGTLVGVSGWVNTGGAGFPNYRDNASWGTSLGRYDTPWFSGAPGLSQGLANLIWIQPAWLNGPGVEGIAPVLIWKAPQSGSYAFSGQFVSGNQPGNGASVAVVDSSGGAAPLSRTSLVPNATQPIGFTKSYTAGDVVQFQVGSDFKAGNAVGLQLQIDATGVPPATVFGVLSAASTNATTASQPISGVVFASGGSNQVLASPEALTGFSSTAPAASAHQTFYVSGVNLPNDITVNATAGWRVSTNTNANTFTGTGLTIPRGASNQIAPTPVYVRLAPNQAPGSKTGTITTASGTASDTVQLTGTVNAPPPSITLTGAFTPFSTTRGVASAAQTCTVSGINLVEPLVLSAPEGYEISNGGSTYNDTIALLPTSGTVATTTISVRIADYAPAANPLEGNLAASSAGAVTRILALTGTVGTNSNAWISARPSSLTGFITTTNNPSDTQAFTVQAANINASLTVSVTDKYEISTNGINFTNSVSLARTTNGGGGGGGTTVIASDSGANYPASGPVTGTNQGFGFGPWTIASGTSATGSAGIFVGNPTAAGIGGMATNSFGLYANANPPTNADFVTASRALLAPLGVGESFSFEWGNNYDSGAAGNKGVNLTAAGGSNVFNLNMAGSAAITLAQGTNAAVEVQPGSAYGTNVMTFTFARTASNTFRVSAPAGRDLGPGFTNTFTVTNDVTGFAFYASGLQNDGNPTNRDSAQPYFNNLQITAPTSGNPGDVAETTLFVRLKAQPASTPANGTITVSGAPAASRQIALFGRVPAAPTITVNPASLTDFRATNGTVSSAKSFTVSAQTLGGSNSLSVVAPANFQVSLSNTAGYTNQLFLSPINEAISNVPVFVRFATNAAPGDYTNSAVQLTAIGLLAQSATNSVLLSGTVYTNNGAAQLSLPDPTTLSGFSTTAGTPSSSQSFVVSGINLTSGITAVVTAPYEVSTNNITFSSNAVSIAPAPNPGSVNDARFFVRVAASATAGTPAGTATLSSSGAANRTVVLNGAVAPTPTLTVSTNALTNFQSVADFPSPEQFFLLGGADIVPVGSNFAPVSINVTGPFQISLNNTNNWVTATNYTPTGTSFSNVPVYVRVASTSAPSTNVTGQVNFSGQGIITPPTVTLSGKTLPRPVINVAPSALGPFGTVAGTASASNSFTVGGSNLLANISVAAPSNYELSTNNGTSWTNAISLAPAFLPAPPGTPPVVVASDSAANYGGGWNTGANGGSGFSEWVITVSNNPPTYFAGAFVGDPNAAGVTGMGTNAFGLYANPDGTAAFASARRAFATPIGVGQTFSLQWGINWDSGAGNKGFTVSAGTNEVARINVGAFPGDVTFNGTTAISGTNGFGTFPMTWTFSRTNTNSLLVTSTGRTNGTNIVFSTNVAITNAPDSFAFFTSAMQAGDQRQAYFNNLQVTAPAAGTDGVVTNTAVLVRLKSSAPLGTANQNVNATSDPYALPKTVALTGEVFPVPAQPGLLFNPNSLLLRGTTGGAAPTNSVALTGTGLTNAVSLSVSGSFELSVDGGATYQSSAASLPTTGGTFGARVFVRFTGSTAAPGIFTGALLANSGSFSAEIPLTATIFSATAPQLVATPTTLTNFDTIATIPSSAKTFLLGGANLSADAAVNSSAGYELSLDGTSFAVTQTIARDGQGFVGPVPVYVRISASATANTSLTGTATSTSAGANNATVNLSGIVYPYSPPNVTLVVPATDPTTIAPGSTIVLSATATDTNKLGQPGVVTSIAFLTNGVPIPGGTIAITNPAPPYSAQFPWTPQLGQLPAPVSALATDNDGLTNTSISRVVRFPEQGEPVVGFVPPLADANIESVAPAGGGNLYIGGSFTSLVRTTTNTTTNRVPGLARLLTNGMVDTNFAPATNAIGGTVLAISPAVDRQSVVVGGTFTNFGGQPRSGLALLSTNGSPIGTFTNFNVPATNSTKINTIARQYDGLLLVGGLFTRTLTNGGTTNIVRNLARLDAETGEIDPTFIPNPSGEVRAIAVQPDGRIVVGGSFGAVAGLTRNNLARLLPDFGLLDPTFVTGAGPSGPVNALALLPDGSIVAGGEFNTYKGTQFYRNLLKVSETGDLFQTFNFSGSTTNAIGGFAGSVFDVHVRPDGPLFITGAFTNVSNKSGSNSIPPGFTNAVGRAVRLLEEGGFDDKFNPGGIGANNSILASAQLDNGNLAIAGSFTSYNGSSAQRLAVLAGYDGFTPMITSPRYVRLDAGQGVLLPLTTTATQPATTLDLQGTLPAGMRYVPSEQLLEGIPLEASPDGQSAGRWLLSITPSAGALVGEPFEFEIIVEPRSVPYETWQEAWEWMGDLPVGAIGGPGSTTGNPSGLSNFTIYALSGGNPRQESAGILPSTVIETVAGQTRLRLSSGFYPLAEVQFSLEYTSSLSGPWQQQAVDLSQDGTEILGNPPAPTGDRQFLRLRIEPAALPSP